MAASAAFMAASAYAYVGNWFGERRKIVTGQGRALGYFSLWWWATSINIFIGAAFYFAAAFGFVDFQLQLAYAVFQRLLLALSLWGLLTYLLFLVTGRDLSRWAALVYGLHGFLLVYVLLASQPTGVAVGDWRTDLVYASAPAVGWEFVNLFAVVLAPVGASLAYFILRLRLPRSEHARRFRATVVSWSLVCWWVVAVLAGQRDAFGLEWFQLVNRFLGLFAALLILSAYRPPAWVRRRFHLEQAAAHAA